MRGFQTTPLYPRWPLGRRQVAVHDSKMIPKFWRLAMAKALKIASSRKRSEKPEEPPSRLPPAERRAIGKQLRDTYPRLHWRLAGTRWAKGPAHHPSRRGCDSPARSGAAALWPDAANAVHLLPRIRRRDGGRPGRHAGHGDPRPGLRRRPSAELRRIRHAGAPADFRHQRSRRDVARALGMGRQTTGRLVRARCAVQPFIRRKRVRRSDRLRAQLSEHHA